MKLFLSLFTLPAFVVSAAIAQNGASTNTPELSKRCVVNAALIDTWHEAGLSRRRVAFSAEGTEPSAFCSYWRNCQAPGENVQCGYDDGLNPPSWRVDASYPLGAGGDGTFFDCVQKARDDWIAATGCGTG